MTAKITPAIVIKTKYVNKQSFKHFKNFVNYIDRNETHHRKNNVENYQEYMSNNQKSTGIFTNTEDIVNDVQKERIKSIFQFAEKNDGVMWQDVISFDNDWLREIGILKTNEDGSQFIDEMKLKQATRTAVNKMWEKEGEIDSIYWTAAIHYNTDNIHIHVATVQTKNFRTRGKRKYSSIEKLKSSMANNLNDRSKENEKINDFIRNNIVKSKKENPILSLKNSLFEPEMVAQFKSIYKQLPQEDKRMWNYSMNGIKHLRPEIDKLTDMHIQKFYPKEFIDFKKQLDVEVMHYKRLYGDTKNAELYRQTKMDDLYKRCGNAILKELREYDKKIIQSNLESLQRKNHNKIQFNRTLNHTMYRINRVIGDNMDHFKNQREFENLQREQELNR